LLLFYEEESNAPNLIKMISARTLKQFRASNFSRGSITPPVGQSMEGCVWTHLFEKKKKRGVPKHFVRVKSDPPAK
jgi:hypothetical protein